MKMPSGMCLVMMEWWIYWIDLKDEMELLLKLRFVVFFPDVMQHTAVHKKHNGKSPVAK